MKFQPRSYKTFAAITGFLLGFGAPIGSVILRAVLEHPHGFEILRDEIRQNSFFYFYMAFFTPIFFALFGFSFGTMLDRIFAQNKVLEMQSFMDDLTGLYNHGHILEEVDKEIERATRYARPLSGMMVDIDNFKSINDRYGHMAGDLALRSIARVMANSLRRIDVIGRYGGDEFLMLLPECPAKTAHVVAERILKAIHDHELTIKGVPVLLTISVGLTSFDSVAGIDRTAFVEKVDGALLEAKRAGRNRIAVL